MYTHVCKTANHWVDSGVKFLKNVDWKDVLKNAAGIAGEFFYVNDIYRVITGTDPITGEKASRLEAAAWLATDLISMGGSKFGKLAKVATKADNLFDVVKGSKIVSRANKAIDGTKTFIKSNVGKLLDTPFGFSPQLAGVGGMTMNAGGTTLREVGQNAKKGFDNLVQAFAKNGDEVVQGGRGTRPPNLSPEKSGRRGAFNEAKRQSGIPTSQSPSRVGPNFDKRNNIQPGRIYEFDIVKDGRKETIRIRDDAGGHIYPDDPTQNRGPHFNDMEGNHYDY